MDEDARRGRTLIGEVHDNYAAALGGIAGHAGLFGSAAGVGGFALTVLRAARGQDGPPPFSRASVAAMTTKSAVPGSSRALGWDTNAADVVVRPADVAGGLRHVGFTGTSLWIDPMRDRYFVLLTNRACGGGSVDVMRDVRRAFHDALADL
jgi:CubicO group peptidase (beta-lactamase class C family)